MTTPAPSRLTMVDGLRGYALLGLFLVHMTGYFEIYNARPDPSWVQETTRFLFQGKSFSLLALCFGFSFFMILESKRRRGEPFAAPFAWRLLVLLALGWFHAMLYRGDIMVVLGATGLLLIPLNYIRNNRLLLLIAAILFVQPFLIARALAAWDGQAWALANPLYYRDGGSLRTSITGSFTQLVRVNLIAGDIPKWSYFVETGRIAQLLGLFLVGLVLGREGFFARPERFARARWIALAVAVAALAPLAWWRHVTCCHSRGPLFWENWIPAGWLDLAGTTIILLSFVQLWLWGAERILRHLVPVGRMTLTLYVAHSCIFIPIFYGFGLGWGMTITQEQSLALGLFACAVQIPFAAWWFTHFDYGPLEWVWRAMTAFSTDIPFRRRAETLKRVAQ